MAAPITHVVLAEKVFNKYFADKDKKQFYIGTLFPDVQKIVNNVSRGKTHLKEYATGNNFSLKSIQAEDAFLAGIKFHSLIDELREGFMSENGAYNLLQTSAYAAIALKLFEDEILYGKIENWREFTDYLNIILPDELLFEIPKETIEDWHKHIQEYLLAKPNDKIRKRLLTLINLPEAAEKINQSVAQMQSNEKICELVEELYNSFDKILEKHDQLSG